MTDEQHPLTEYKIMINFVFEKKRSFFKGMKYIVQNKPFRFGLKIKNIDDKSSPKGKIKHLSIRSGEGGTIYHESKEEFCIPELNPGQEIILWWPEPMRTIIKGQTAISCSVIPDKSDLEKFITYQYNAVSKKEDLYGIPNHWLGALSIRGELEQQQSMTNFLIFILTLLVFLDGVWGLNIIFKTIFKIFGWLLNIIGFILTKLGS